MSTRPSQDFIWATTGTKVDPGVGPKDTGFGVAARPPASWLNYLLNLIARWIAYLEAVTLEIIESKIFEVRQVFYPNAPTAVGTAAEGPVGDGMSGFEDTANETVNTRAAGLTAVAGYLPPYPTWVLILLNASVSNGCRIYTGYASAQGNAVIAALDDVYYAAQWEANIGSVGGTAVGANGADLYMGLHSDADAIGSSGFDNGAANSFAMFRKAAGDTNWQCRVADGAAATTATSGVPPVEDVPQLFRIEYHGVNTPVGVENVNATVRFYIDDVLVSEVADANVPTGTIPLGLSMQAYATATGPNANLGLVISPIATIMQRR
jgi:hypothetical protein